MAALTPGAAVPARVATSTTVATLLAASGSRRAAVFFNEAAGSLYIKYGSAATATDYTVKVAPGGYFEMFQPIYTGIVTGILDAGSGNAQVTAY